MTMLSDIKEKPGWVILVDGSQEPETREVASNAAISLGVDFTYVSANPGAAHQKNVGLRLARANRDVKYAFFLDDDIRVRRDYFSTAIEILSSGPWACIGGYDSGHVVREFSRLALLFGLATRKGGFRLLRSGNTSYGKPHEHTEPAEWVPGGMMVIDLSKVAGEFNDEFLIYGDDLEFQRRCVAEGAIAVSASLPVEHLSSTIGKESLASNYENYSHFRWWMSSNDRRVQKFFVLAASFAVIAYCAANLDLTERRQQAVGEINFLKNLILGKSKVRKRDYVSRGEWMQTTLRNSSVPSGVIELPSA
jgi:GT2 family glycosyltransferase